MIPIASTGDVSHCLNAGGMGRQDGTANALLTPNGGRGGTGVGAVAFNWQSGGDCRGLEPQEITNALHCGQTPAAMYGAAVRRLTPRECERLQGFQWRCTPDTPGAWQDGAGRYWSPDYTLIPTKTARQIEADYYAYLRATDPSLSEEDARRLAADGPRYKALGNSMAVPVMRWIGERIEQVHEIASNEAAA